MKFFMKGLFFFSFLTLVSCAKVGYLFEQGSAQLGLQSKAKANEEVLKSPRIHRTHKEKIQYIGKLKKYFYGYWKKPETKIYTRTTFLKSKAVSYLVIASKYDRIETHESCFPIVGCFPYLGFFEKKSAEDFAKELRSKDLVTYIRPVYAYSTLGYFEDTILSSFFKYNEYELSELIFHELFHTIFFVKDEVELNENLANYFSERMVVEYLEKNNQDELLKEYLEERRVAELVDNKIVALATELQMRYEKNSPLDKMMAREVLNEFLRERFFPEIKKICSAEKVLINEEDGDCQVLKKEWNNASFAAFLTYEKKADQLGELQKKLGLDLVGFFDYIKSRYQQFEKEKPELEFSEFLFDTTDSTYAKNDKN